MAGTETRARQVADGLALAYLRLSEPDHALTPEQLERARSAVREAMAAQFAAASGEVAA